MLMRRFKLAAAEGKLGLTMSFSVIMPKVIFFLSPSCCCCRLLLEGMDPVEFHMACGLAGSRVHGRVLFGGLLQCVECSISAAQLLWAKWRLRDLCLQLQHCHWVIDRCKGGAGVVPSVPCRTCNPKSKSIRFTANPVQAHVLAGSRQPTQVNLGFANRAKPPSKPCAASDANAWLLGSCLIAHPCQPDVPSFTCVTSYCTGCSDLVLTLL